MRLFVRKTPFSSKKGDKEIIRLSLEIESLRFKFSISFPQDWNWLTLKQRFWAKENRSAGVLSSFFIIFELFKCVFQISIMFIIRTIVLMTRVREENREKSIDNGNSEWTHVSTHCLISWSKADCSRERCPLSCGHRFSGSNNYDGPSTICI